MHGYELEYFFGRPLRLPKIYNDSTIGLEQDFSKEIMNFLHDLGSNPSSSEVWPKYDSFSREWLVLNESIAQEKFIVEKDVYRKSCNVIEFSQQSCSNGSPR